MAACTSSLQPLPSPHFCQFFAAQGSYRQLLSYTFISLNFWYLVVPHGSSAQPPISAIITPLPASPLLLTTLHFLAFFTDYGSPSPLSHFCHFMAARTKARQLPPSSIFAISSQLRAPNGNPSYTPNSGIIWHLVVTHGSLFSSPVLLVSGIRRQLTATPLLPCLPPPYTSSSFSDSSRNRSLNAGPINCVHASA